MAKICHPEAPTTLCGGYEEAWVKMLLDNSPIPQACLDYYTKNYDLPSILPYEDDGTPISLKAILWNRLDHWSYLPANAQDFKKWHQEQFVAHTSTHRQLINNQ